MPIGDESFPIRGALAVLGSPAMIAYVQPFIGMLLIEQERMKGLFVVEMPVTRLTNVSSRLDVPLDHAPMLFVEFVAFIARIILILTVTATSFHRWSIHTGNSTFPECS